jgi:hypothetical protein
MWFPRRFLGIGTPDGEGAGRVSGDGAPRRTVATRRWRTEKASWPGRHAGTERRARVRRGNTTSSGRTRGPRLSLLGAPASGRAPQRSRARVHTPSRGKAQGSIGRSEGCKALRQQRTHQRTNALRSSESESPPHSVVRRSTEHDRSGRWSGGATARRYRPRWPGAHDHLANVGKHAGFVRRAILQEPGRSVTVDAVQLLVRGKLRRVERHREGSKEPSYGHRGAVSRRATLRNRETQRCHGCSAALREAGQPQCQHWAAAQERQCGTKELETKGLQHGEPQDRFQGATNLKSAKWRKPSKPGGTARAERVRSVAASDRQARGAALGASSEARIAAAPRSSFAPRSGRLVPMPMEGRIYDNPKRGAQVQVRTTRTIARSRATDGWDHGQRIPDWSPKER